MSPLLNTANKIYVGSSEADRVYRGSDLIYQKAAPAGVNLFSGVPTFADQAVDSQPYSMATEFYVNKAGCFLTKVRYLQPTVGTLTPRTMALYSTVDGNTGTKVGGDWTMPTPVAGQWCTYTLPTPLALTANTRYRITTFHPSNAGFARTLNYFWSGGGGEGNTTITIGGFLVRPASGQALNTVQGSFAAASSMQFPSDAYQYASYYSDVEVIET